MLRCNAIPLILYRLNRVTTSMNASAKRATHCNFSTVPALVRESDSSANPMDAGKDMYRLRMRTTRAIA